LLRRWNFNGQRLGFPISEVPNSPEEGSEPSKGSEPFRTYLISSGISSISVSLAAFKRLATSSGI